ncbi:MAG: twin-arginine translocase TatA/TatE family subunit [Bdellovibrionales bacterium]|nr:twin-arginine translocase TatA/TatE family subunit [Bdellovibrionales bacterium]
MFGISIPELLLVFFIVLLVFGPDKLPEIARTLGKWTAKFRKTSDDIRREVYNSIYEPAKDFSNRSDPKKIISEIETDIKKDFNKITAKSSEEQ